MKVGDEFTSLNLLDPDWTPAEGERYADAPMAPMRVTRVTKTTVWYGYANFRAAGSLRLDRATFEERYGAQIRSAS